MSAMKKVIFDLDGTLYVFKGGKASTFAASDFYRDLRIQICSYIAKKLNVPTDQAERIVGEVGVAYDGELSIGFEEMFDIDRYEYYQQTWGIMDAAKYIDANEKLKSAMRRYAGRSVLLTAAPRVWADKVLELLDLNDIFGDFIISGEPDVRKPNTAVFEQAKDLLNTEYESITSIGDQNYSDIEPAKALGMKTIIVHSKQESADQRADTIFDALTLLSGEDDET